MKPRLVYLYNQLAQEGVDHIRCRRLLAALEERFNVTKAFAIWPDEVVSGGVGESLRYQVLPESALFSPPVDVLYIEGQFQHYPKRHVGERPWYQYKASNEVLADYSAQGGITILDLFRGPVYNKSFFDEVDDFQEYLRKAHLPSLHLTSSRDDFVSCGHMLSDEDARNRLPRAIDPDNEVFPGIFGVDTTGHYPGGIDRSLRIAYEGVSQLLLRSPRPVRCSLHKVVLMGNRSTRLLADDMFVDSILPPVFGALNDSGGGCSITITGGPFTDIVLEEGNSDAIRLLTNLLSLLLAAQEQRRPYLGLPDTVETLRWQVPPDADEPTIAEFAHKVHDAIDDARMPAWVVEGAGNSVRAALRDCWAELEMESRKRLTSGEAFFRLFREEGEISFAGSTVEYAGAIEIELEAKLFMRFREHLAAEGQLAQLTSNRRDALARYLDPAQDWNLTLGAMSYSLKKCAERSTKDSLLDALEAYLGSHSEDPGFWLGRFPKKLDEMVELRNGAAHKSRIPISSFEEFRSLALGLHSTSPFCDIVNQAPRTTA